MTMQSSGPISMGQAMNECRVGGRYNAGSSALSKLAGVSPGQRYPWSAWYGKSFGTLVTENWTQYYTVNYSASNSADLGRSLVLYRAGFPFITDGGNYFGRTGGDHTAPVGNWPGMTQFPQVQGFFRAGTNLTILCVNGSLDGLTFQSSIGDNVPVTNDCSYSQSFGPNLWTFYGCPNAVNQGGPRTYTINLVGSINRPQPPNGYIDGHAPPSTGGSGSHGGDDSCFVAGSLVLMADRTWKPIQTIQAGDMVMGPTGPVFVKRLHVSRVGTARSLLRFREDPRHMWSAEHPHWVRQNGKQWWWVQDHVQIRKEIEMGLLGGLREPNSFLAGPAEFATLDGFAMRTPEVVVNHDPQTLVFIPVVEGSPIFVNGYMVSAFVNEFNYDYTKLDWLQNVGDFTVDREMLSLNQKWVRDYHAYFESLKA